MGGSQSTQRVYAVPIGGSETKDMTPILRAATHPDALVQDFGGEDSCSNCWELLHRGAKIAQDGTGKCLGYRPRQVNGSLNGYVWMSFNDVIENAVALGSGLLRTRSPVVEDAAPVCLIEPSHFEDEAWESARSMKLMGIFSVNRVEWFICEQAGNAYNIALVPLYDTLGLDALKFILTVTHMRLVVCSIDCLPTLLEAVKETKMVKYIIILEDKHQQVSADSEEKARALGVQLLPFWDIVKQGRSNRIPPSPGPPDAIATVCFTSGTTGNPKGVLLTQRNFVSCICGTIRGPVATCGFNVNQTDCTISYLPLAHVLERLVCNVIFTIGARIGIYAGDSTKLLDDVRLLKPTVFVSVPRVFNRINDAVLRGVTEKSALQRFFFNRGMSTKLESTRSNGATDNRLWDGLVFNKTKSLMGNNVRYMISGGAPLNAVVQERMKVLFCAPLMEGYGLSETFGPAFLAAPKDPVAGHVGGPIPCNEFRLLSVPEMNYYVTDEMPRGELLLRGHAITPGYFRDKAATAEALDGDGWFHTGDICVILQCGRLKIIDRRKNIFKLAQGEYVAPEKIEGVYQQAPLVAQVFVFGYSSKNSLVAIVVPDVDVARLWLRKQPGKTGVAEETQSLKMIIASKEFRDAVKQELEAVGKSAGLKGFEKVKEIHISDELFSIENNLMTPTQKIRRHEARMRYAKEIDEMYSRLP